MFSLKFHVHDLRLPYVVSIDFWQYKVEVEVLQNINKCLSCIFIKVFVVKKTRLRSILHSMLYIAPFDCVFDIIFMKAYYLAYTVLFSTLFQSAETILCICVRLRAIYPYG